MASNTGKIRITFFLLVAGFYILPSATYEANSLHEVTNTLSDEEKEFLRPTMEQCAKLLLDPNPSPVDDADTIGKMRQCYIMRESGTYVVLFTGSQRLSSEDQILKPIADHCAKITIFPPLENAVVDADAYPYSLRGFNREHCKELFGIVLSVPNVPRSNFLNTTLVRLGLKHGAPNFRTLLFRQSVKDLGGGGLATPRLAIGYIDQGR